MRQNKLVWIKAGYYVFGRQGPNGLNVELLAKRVKKASPPFTIILVIWKAFKRHY